MEIKFRYLMSVLVVMGIILLFAHIGIFVFIYFPACLVIGLILLVKWKRGSLKPIRIGKKTESESKIKTVKVPKYYRVRRVLGATVLTIVLFTPIVSYFWDEKGPILFVMFIDPMFAPFVYSGLIVGAYLLKSKRIRRPLALALLAVALLTQFLSLLLVIAMLIQGYLRSAYLYPLIIMVPASIIYATIEPSIRVPQREREKKGKNRG